MSFEFIKKLPTPDQIREEYPVPDTMQVLKKKETKKLVTFLPENQTNFW